MTYSTSIMKIKNDLKSLKEYELVLYGSYLDENFIQYRSDIDIAVITRSKIHQTNINLWRDLLGKIPSQYDVKIFELLPLFVQIRIINSYRIIFGNSLKISEYFYKFRKLWKDMIFRFESNQFKGIEEKINGIERRKRLIQNR
ncbi:MAG: nucleotidyltransferase domain-containing protein [Candidatus Hodarchaeota archaeon]